MWLVVGAECVRNVRTFVVKVFVYRIYYNLVLMELRRCFLIIMATLVGAAQCQLDEMGVLFSTKKYCGERLSRALSEICHGNYNTLRSKTESYQKKSYWNSQQFRSLEKRDAASHAANYPFKDKADATAMLSFRRRRKRGVYNECCEKPCSKDELLSYCGATTPQSPSRQR